MTPAKALKILLIEAENDIADLHDMCAGIADTMQLTQEQRDQVNQNLIINHNWSDTGHDFILSMQRQLDYYVPDLVIADPLLSFIGDDISKQEVVGRFCRNWLNPVLAACNVCFMGIHHTGKPPARDPKGKKTVPKSLIEWAYNMIGSSELTNWARAVMILNPVEGWQYELLLSKRGQRALAKHPNGALTKQILLEHSREDIFWLQTDPPEEVASATPSDPKPDPPMKPRDKAMAVATSNLHEFLATIPQEGLIKSELLTNLCNYSANKLGIHLGQAFDHASRLTFDKLIENHKICQNGKTYCRGPNA
jgi:hypothetical protein